MPIGPPMTAASMTNLPLLVLKAALQTFLRLPRTPLYSVAQSAENASWMKVLTNGARKMACSVETNGAIDSAMPRTTVSTAQVTPAAIP